MARPLRLRLLLALLLAAVAAYIVRRRRSLRQLLHVHSLVGNDDSNALKNDNTATEVIEDNTATEVIEDEVVEFVEVIEVIEVAEVVEEIMTYSDSDTLANDNSVSDALKNDITVAPRAPPAPSTSAGDNAGHQDVATLTYNPASFPQ
eukprot:2900074-Prymnesium_polylepis.1